MDRLERLLDLVHVLQTAPRPVPLSALKDQFADYAEGSDEAVRRKFERDKAELARIGVVLRYVEDEEGDAGYFVDAEATYLPDLPLDEADRAVLATAAQAALADPSFPHRRALRLALAKLGATPDDAVPEVHLAHGAALTARKRVRLRYRKARADDATERDVDPYGLFLRRGAWYLVGRDHRSGETRMFRVSRIEEATPNTKKPGTPDFEVPADFDLDAVMRTSPLRYAVHAPVEARVRVDPDVAFLLERQWGPPDADGVFTVETTHLDFLVDQVLGLGRRAELLAPPEGRARVAAALRAVLEAHGAEEAAS